MKFSEAVLAMEEGKSVRRKGWENDTYWEKSVKVNTFNHQFKQLKVVYSNKTEEIRGYIPAETIFTDDWEVCEKPVSKQNKTVTYKTNDTIEVDGIIYKIVDKEGN